MRHAQSVWAVGLPGLNRQARAFPTQPHPEACADASGQQAPQYSARFRRDPFGGGCVTRARARCCWNGRVARDTRYRTEEEHWPNFTGQTSLTRPGHLPAGSAPVHRGSARRPPAPPGRSPWPLRGSPVSGHCTTAHTRESCCSGGAESLGSSCSICSASPCRRRDAWDPPAGTQLEFASAER